MTVKEIAELAGVSPAAVSFVLNGKPGVSPSTRERITKLLEENGFEIKHTPDKNAGPSIIRFIRYYDTGDLVERNDDFITQVMEGAEGVLCQEQYIMSITNTDSKNLPAVLQNATPETVAGIIFLGTEFNADHFNLLENCQVPFVAVDNCFRGHKVTAVDMDNIGGARLALQHLYDLGHRKIAYLKSSHETESLRERSMSFHYALDALSLPLHSTVSIPISAPEACEAMNAYLDGRPDLPTAFFADNDIIAAGALRSLLQHHIRIPEDVSIIGFDNSQIASLITPPLTTVHICKKEMGIFAAERLIAMIRQEEPFITKTSVGVSLIQRSTTAAPRTEEFHWED